MKKKLLWLIPIILLVVIYQLIFNSSYQASNEALGIVLEATLSKDYMAFIPDDADQTGIILYPGGKVEYEAYAPLMKALSEQGYSTFIVDMPLDLALFGNNKASTIIEEHPTLSKWYMMGHSLGGVMAAQYTYENSDQIEGLILLASYPQDKHDFKNIDMKVLSILGELDGLVDTETFENSKLLLPDDATFVILDGANHGQMGSYGKQKNDIEATISPEEQLYTVIESIMEWMN